jgi:poly(hydroxyalkanoate) granule-associated protein
MPTKESSTQKSPPEQRKVGRSLWLAGLGLVASAEAGSKRLFQTLVERGEGYEPVSKKRATHLKERVVEVKDKAKDKAGSGIEKLGGSFDDKVAGTLKRLGVPSKDEVQQLSERVQEMAAKLEKMKPKARISKATKTA